MRRLKKVGDKIDIGCKHCIKKDYTGIDIKDFGQAIVWDVRHGIPVSDGTIENIYCRHFLEHLEDRDIEDFFMELWRVCRSGAEIEIIVPRRNCKEAYTHNHLSFWDEIRFEGIATGYPGERFKIIRMDTKTCSGYPEVHVVLEAVK